MSVKTLSVLASALLGFALSTGAVAAEQPKTLAEIHGPAWPKSADGFVTKNQCLQCHGSYDQLAEKTAKLEPNPHKSHLGAVNCEDCHKVDKAQPELMCNSCHKFTIRAKDSKAPAKK